MKWREKSGFTLLELLVVVSIIAVLLTITLLSSQKLAQKARMRLAKSEMLQLVSGIRDYKNEYDRLPCNPSFINTNAADVVFSTNQYTQIMEYIHPGNETFLGAPANPRKRQFLAISVFDIEDGEIVDPWGTPYSITLDTNWDDNPRGGVSIVSAGPRKRGQAGPRFGDGNDMAVDLMSD